jgi:hypothetical protein
MTDIVEWLRDKSSEHNMYRCDEAADRIEQLEAALCVIVKARENKPENCSDEYLVWCCIDIARAALAGEKKDE